MTKLPEKLADVLELAMADLVKAENTPGYSVFMGDWHRPHTNAITGETTCSVCLAGAVMAFSLGAKSGVYVDPGNYYGDENHDYWRLLALNDLRLGWIYLAVNSVYPVEGRRNLSIAEYPEDHPVRILNEKWHGNVVDYETNPNLFHKQMAELVEDLRKFDL